MNLIGTSSDDIYVEDDFMDRIWMAKDIIAWKAKLVEGSMDEWMN